MSRLAKYLIALYLLGAMFSCAERACKVKSTKAKWKHYNALQFGATPKKKR